MIRHVVFFSVRDGADRETVYQGLQILSGNPHALHFEVGRNLRVDALTDDAVDFIVYGEFADEDALERFKAHETYAQSIAQVRPLRELRMAADFRSNPM